MADHTGKRAKPKIDTNSIRTTTLISFVVFALFLVLILLGLVTFFLNSYFERVRAQEVIRTAEALETQFVQDVGSFDSYAVNTASTNGIYIQIDSEDRSLIYDGTRTVQGANAFDSDISSIKAKLTASTSDSAAETRRDSAGSGARLIYASYITGGSPGSILCIIAPLYPDQVTLRILRNMVTYISVIVLLV